MGNDCARRESLQNGRTVYMILETKRRLERKIIPALSLFFFVSVYFFESG